MGFQVAKHGQLTHNLSSEVLMIYRSQTDQYDYMIDGVVLSLVSHSQLQTSAPQTTFLCDSPPNPTTCVAFKINLQEQMRETVITGVDWSYTRHGRLMPVAEFHPVFIDGARIHRAFVYNASNCLHKLQLGVGTQVTVTRSGGVIPTIVKVGQVVGIPCQPQVPYPWHWQGADIVLDDPDHCPEVIVQRYVHFFETLEIPGIREGMLKRMIDCGLSSLPQILTASKEQLRTVPGIGPKRSEAYYHDIRTQLQNARLYRLLLASNTFPSGVGKCILRQISHELPNLLKSCTAQELTQLHGIGKVRATKILEGLTQFKSFAQTLPIDVVHLHQAPSGLPLVQGKTFVLTCLEDHQLDHLEDFILDHGGFLGTHAEPQTCCVVTGNVSMTSSKQEMACQMGVPVYTLTEFSSLYGYQSQN
jgi:DNA ligase (NAD+)